MRQMVVKHVTLSCSKWLSQHAEFLVHALDCDEQNRSMACIPAAPGCQATVRYRSPAEIRNSTP
jgi:hypothetical protein